MFEVRRNSMMRVLSALGVRVRSMDNEHNHIHIHMLCTFVLTISCLLLTTLPQSRCQPPVPASAYDYSLCKAQSYKCGTQSIIFYPFWGENRPSQCDPFQLSCYVHDNNAPKRIGSQNFIVEEINSTTRTMRVVPTDRVDDVCSQQFFDTYGNSNPPLFQYSASVYNITVFFDGCTPIPDFPSGRNYTCGHALHYFEEEHKEHDLLKNFPALKSCKKRLHVPTVAPLDDHAGGGVDVLKEALDKGFEVKYDIPQDCTSCGGNDEGPCGRSDDIDAHVVSCHYCPAESDALRCPPPKSKRNWERKVIVGVVSTVLGALAVGIAGYFILRRKKNSYAVSYLQSRSLSSEPSSKDTEKGTLSFTQSFVPGVHLFSCDELEEATNNFDSSKELGEGNSGTVYFGKLRDGRSVAVKRLYENNSRRVAQFMNEIKILARLVHPNLVTLYGCTSRHSRELLLVYEYIPNGTVADHLHGQRSKPGKLPWHIRMNIAVETASALKYLHLSDIIHRDVKTNNILLDNNFRVKVADFGLSRLFPDHVTHASRAPHGTPGYVDPEYQECYQLTNKSDVYSYGVVLVELISSLPAVDITRHRHEINLANLAINKIHSQALHELVDPTLGFESDFKVRKMINAVAELAFQCLQSSRDMRPSMEEVADTLNDIQSDGKQ